MTTRALTLALSLLALAACDAPAEADPCATTDAITPYGLSLRTVVTDGDGLTEEVSCATVTISDPDSAWQVSAASPSSVDVSPGRYEVAADWRDGSVRYASDTVLVEHDRDLSETVLSLCADVAGDWRCTDGGAEWPLTVERSGCALSLVQLGQRAQIDGHCIDSDDVTGTVGPEGEQLWLSERAADREIECWRVD